MHFIEKKELELRNFLLAVHFACYSNIILFDVVAHKKLLFSYLNMENDEFSLLFFRRIISVHC